MDAATLRATLDYSPETGEFRWRVKTGRKPVIGAVAGSTDALGYVRIRLFRQSYLAHRLAWLHVHGAWPTLEIDHKNGNPSDNRICNLRQVTSQQNKQNRHKVSAASGLRGVHWLKANKKWRALIMHNRKSLYLGLFDTAEEAYAAYCAKAKEVHTHNEVSTGE